MTREIVVWEPLLLLIRVAQDVFHEGEKTHSWNVLLSLTGRYALNGYVLDSNVGREFVQVIRWEEGVNIVMGEDGTSAVSVYKLSNDQSVMGRSYEIGETRPRLWHIELS